MRRATRLIVSSAKSRAATAHARHSKNFTSLQRRFSYFSPARSRSESKHASNLSKACCVRAGSSFDERALFIAKKLLPLALQDECGPVVRRLPTLLSEHFDLRRAQGCCRRPTIFQHPGVEESHQLGCRRVVHSPHTRRDASRSRIHEAASQPYQTLSSNFLAESGVASAQDDQFRGQVKVVNVIQTQKTILGRAVF